MSANLAGGSISDLVTSLKNTWSSSKIAAAIAAAAGGTFTVFTKPDGNGSLGNHTVRNVPGTGNYRFTFPVPLDFNALVSINLIAISSVTNASADIDVTSDYGKEGEAEDNHSEARDGGTTPTALTAGVIARFDVSDVFSSLEAGDQCGFNWDNNSIGGTISALTVELRYTR